MSRLGEVGGYAPSGMIHVVLRSGETVPDVVLRVLGLHRLVPCSHIPLEEGMEGPMPGTSMTRGLGVDVLSVPLDPVSGGSHHHAHPSGQDFECSDLSRAVHRLARVLDQNVHSSLVIHHQHISYILRARV